MSIFRSGVVKPVFLVCVKPCLEGGITFKEGEKYELVLEMAAMYVVRTPNKLETVVPKDAFVLAKES